MSRTNSILKEEMILQLCLGVPDTLALPCSWGRWVGWNFCRKRRQMGFDIHLACSFC